MTKKEITKLFDLNSDFAPEWAKEIPDFLGDSTKEITQKKLKDQIACL